MYYQSIQIANSNYNDIVEAETAQQEGIRWYNRGIQNREYRQKAHKWDLVSRGLLCLMGLCGGIALILSCAFGLLLA